MSDIIRTDSFIDDLQAVIDAKSDDTCQNFECKNQSYYSVTVTYGAREKDKEIIKLCPDCMEMKKAECKSWCWGFLPELIPGKKPLENVKKKRGRPKNTLR